MSYEDLKCVYSKLRYARNIKCILGFENLVQYIIYRYTYTYIYSLLIKFLCIISWNYNILDIFKLNKICYWNSFHLFFLFFNFWLLENVNIWFTLYFHVVSLLYSFCGTLRLSQCALSWELAKQSLLFSFSQGF